MSLNTSGYKNIKKNDIDYKMFKISLFLLKRQFKEIYLVTDNKGAECLEDLSFTNIDTSLENLVPKNTYALWNIGKFFTYQIAATKGDPFLHIDNDVFIFDKLPNEICNINLLAHHEEKGVYDGYDVDFFVNSLINKYFFDKNKTYNAPNVCLFGGKNLSFINYFATEALKVCLDPDNFPKIINTYYPKCFTPPCVVEQYYLGLISKIMNVNITYLFKDYPFSDEQTSFLLQRERGFLHFWSLKYKKNNFELFLDNLINKYNL
jgi:hypothetical protein